MKDLAAYILTITSISERLNDAMSLRHSLATLKLPNEVEVLPCIYWKDEASIIKFLSEFPEHTFSRDYLDVCLKGQVCCTLSHIKAWRKLVNSDHEGAFIFEDDIYISDTNHFREIVKSISNTKNLDWLRIHLHKQFRTEILQTKSSSMFVNDPSIWGFAAYYVSRHGAEKLLSSFHNIYQNIDNIIPDLGKKGVLKCKTVKKVVVEHHAFNGDEKDLENRQEIERTAIKLQKSISTIYSSPKFTKGEPLYQFILKLDQIRKLRTHGYTVLKGVVDNEMIEQSRNQVLDNLSLFKNTRPTPSALHLAGFHRFPELESLHTALSSNTTVLDFLKAALKDKDVRTIGLSDITINRSQGWHKDLLRDGFQSYLGNQDICWGDNGGGVYKILLFLQSGSGLKVVKGSHLLPTSLENDTYSEPDDDDSLVKSVPVEAGDIIVMDIRTSHRGSPEKVFQCEDYVNHPRILISTVLGCNDSELTKAMEIGNFHRLIDWMERNP